MTEWMLERGQRTNWLFIIEQFLNTMKFYDTFNTENEVNKNKNMR